jgi:hypothetical protein
MGGASLRRAQVPWCKYQVSWHSGDTQAHIQHGDRISLLLFFQNNESRPKIKVGLWDRHTVCVSVHPAPINFWLLEPILTRSDNKIRELAKFFYIRRILHYEFVPSGQSTKFTIEKCRKGCIRKLDGNDANFSPTTCESCITTMHLLTHHCLWGSF